MNELKDMIARNGATLPGEFAGGAALVLLTLAGLSLSGLF